jgi:hypothetical protein
MTPDEIDNAVDAWHEGGGHGVQLHEYLGWTWEQYGHWAETGTPPDHTGNAT